MSGKRTVAVSMLGSAVLIVGGRLLTGSLPTYRQLGGLFFAYLMLSIGAELAPDLASAFALLLLIGVLLATAEQAGPALTSLLGQKGQAGAGAAATDAGRSAEPESAPGKRQIPK